MSDNEVSIALPGKMHFCAAHCFAIVLKDGHYESRPGSLLNGTVTVKQFTRKSVVLERADPPNQFFPRGLAATMSGKVSSAGDSLTDGKIEWTFGRSGTYDMLLAWDGALDSLPGDDNFLPPVVLHFCAAHCMTCVMLFLAAALSSGDDSSSPSVPSSPCNLDYAMCHGGISPGHFIDPEPR